MNYINNYQKIYEQMHTTAIDVIEKIVKDTDNRISNCKENIKLLAQGVFYAKDYARLLNDYKQTKNIDYFKKKGSFYHGYTNPQYFDMTKNETDLAGFHPYKFTIKKNIKAKDALESVIKGLSLIGCATVIELGDYSALLKVLGEEKFNAIFDRTSKTPFIIGENNESYLSCIRTAGVVNDLSEEKIRAGDRFYIDGAYVRCRENKDSDLEYKRIYSFKHPMDCGHAYNVICKSDNEKDDEPLFLGLGLNPNGATYDEIVETLITEYNKTPIDDLSILTEEQYNKMISRKDEDRLKVIKKLSTDTITNEDFFEMNGGQVRKVTYNFELIQKLIDSNIKTACQLFAKWNDL